MLKIIPQEVLSSSAEVVAEQGLPWLKQQNEDAMKVTAGKWRKVSTPSCQISVLSQKRPRMTRSPPCHGATFFPRGARFCPSSPMPTKPRSSFCHIHTCPTSHPLCIATFLYLTLDRRRSVRHDLFKQWISTQIKKWTRQDKNKTAPCLPNAD